jgi:transcriptional regulator with XRE-family HTH domain
MPEVAHEDPVMPRVREWMDKQEPKLTLQALGERMGFPAESARKSAWQFLQCKVPRLDTLRRFADASGVPIEEWVAEPKKPKNKPRKVKP